MKSISVWYEKTGRARYISHLDMNRCMQRAIKRAGIPAWHTEGFNPHVYLTFALPLSLGYESLCEIMDFKTESDMPLEEMKERFNAHLPEGIRVRKVNEAVLDAEKIAFAEYEVKLKSGEIPCGELMDKFASFWAGELITVVKKTKKREVELNLKELLTLWGQKCKDGFFCFSLRAPAGGVLTVNPGLLTNAFLEWAGLPSVLAYITRPSCLTESLEEVC